MGKIVLALRKMVCFPVKIYQYFISPLLRPSCRFYPSCSEYFMSTIEKNGILKGGLLAIKRIVSCHPWSQGGYDPVKTNDEKL